MNEGDGVALTSMAHPSKPGIRGWFSYVWLRLFGRLSKESIEVQEIEITK